MTDLSDLSVIPEFDRLVTIEIEAVVKSSAQVKVIYKVRSLRK